MLTITLPWPPAGLNPNRARRLHWGARAKLAKRYRRDCAWTCVAAGARRIGGAGAAVSIVFHPPDAARRDLDNMLGAIKAGLDAVSEAVGIDDSLFELTLTRGPAVRDGSVVLTVLPRQQVSETRQLLSEQAVV